MDKTRNKIFVGCLALLLVIVAGYALFSQNLNITGIAKAEGDFELTTSVVDLNESWAKDYGFLNRNAVSSGIVKNPLINVSGNVVTTSVELGIPGSFYNFAIKIKNTGTIPAKLSSIIDKTNNVPILDSDLGENETYPNDVYSVHQDENNPRGNFMFAELGTDSGYIDDYTSDITTGDRWFEEQNFNIDMLKAVLDPGEEVYYFIHYNWASTSTTPGEPLTLNWSLEFNFEQVKAN